MLGYGFDEFRPAITIIDKADRLHGLLFLTLPVLLLKILPSLIFL